MQAPSNDIILRIRLIYFMMALFALIIVGKVVYIQFVEGDYWREQHRNSTLRYMTIEAARGDILADDGRLLATSVPVYEIRMDLSRQVLSDDIFIQGLDSLCRALSNLFRDRTPSQYRSELLKARENQERYFLIKRNVSYNQLLQLREFPIYRLGRFKGGLIVNERTRREMPYRSLAARTIGYERAGVYVGLEGAYREYLEGMHGKRLMQRISGGNWMPINDENEIQPKNGMDLITTINVRMQDIAENALRRQLHKFAADYGTVVVMEVHTGKIKAISNLARNDNGFYEENFNFAIGESTEPGSTFKLATMIALLEDGAAKPSDIIHTGNGETRYADRLMRDAKEGGFGTITLREAFELSSNVGISKAVVDAYRGNPARFIDKIKATGIDKPLGLEISGEGTPNIKDVNSPTWSGVSLPWMAIGYEVAITLLQMLSLYNAVANNGRLMKPMLVEEIRQTGKTIRTFAPSTINRSIASQSTLETIREMLIGVVKNGTAKNIHTQVYEIAGKTGTAQVAQTRHGYRSSGGVTYQASFAGYFPASAPMYSMIVVIHGPKGWIYSGSQVAAPVFREISDRIYASYLIETNENDGAPALASLPSFRNALADDLSAIFASLNHKQKNIPSGNWLSCIQQNDTLRFREKNNRPGLVPDIIGMGLRDALYILENAGLSVHHHGKGAVVRQSPAPGSPLREGTVAYIELR